MKRFLMLLSFTTAIFSQAFAETITVYDGQEIPLGVDPTSGVTVQLPTFVRVVTPPRMFSVVPITAPAPAPANGNNQEAQSVSDIRTFIVKTTNRSSADERITFMLADEKTLTIRFRSQVGADNFIDLRYPRTTQTSRSKLDGGFLSAERNLMLALLKDEAYANRQVLNTEIKLGRYPDLQIALLRQYQADNLTGYVFSITNTGKNTLQINPTVISIGQPNRAILTQLDHEILKPCAEDNSADPRGTGCLTVLRMIVQGKNQGIPALGGLRNSMPFVAINKDAKEQP